MLIGSAHSAAKSDGSQREMSLQAKWSVGQHLHGQNAGQQLARPIRPASSRALPPFDTALQRFATAPPSASAHHAVLPPEMIDRLRNGISVKSWQEHSPRPNPIPSGEGNGRKAENKNTVANKKGINQLSLNFTLKIV